MSYPLLIRYNNNNNNSNNNNKQYKNSNNNKGNNSPLFLQGTTVDVKTHFVEYFKAEVNFRNPKYTTQYSLSSKYSGVRIQVGDTWIVTSGIWFVKVLGA